MTVKSDPNRDPRKHIVSIIYLVQVASDASPKAGDDAKDAKFYELRQILDSKDEIAFDHHEILRELIEKKFKNLYH